MLHKQLLSFTQSSPNKKFKVYATKSRKSGKSSNSRDTVIYDLIALPHEVRELNSKQIGALKNIGLSVEIMTNRSNAMV